MDFSYYLECFWLPQSAAPVIRYLSIAIWDSVIQMEGSAPMDPVKDEPESPADGKSKLTSRDEIWAYFEQARA